MKRFYSHITLTTLSLFLLLTACTQDEVMNQEGTADNDLNGLLCINNVNVTDFATESGSRATNDGNTITFANEDRIGLFLITDGKSTQNVPFRFDGNNWINESNATYSGKIERAIAYFPYDATLKPVSSVDELKEAKEWDKAEEFADKDLLVAEIEVNAPKLEINFKHAFSLISISAKGSVAIGEETYEYPLDLSDVSFSIGDDLYTPDAVNGEYLCLVDAEKLEANEFRYFYSSEGTAYAKTVKETVTLESNHKYSFPCVTSAASEETALAAGDFYCVSNEGTVVVIPGSAASLPAGLACKGIVFHVMDNEAWNTFKTNNNLSDSDLSGYNGQHGLIISIQNGNPFGTMTADQLKNNVFIEEELTFAGKTDTYTGYKLTQELRSASTETSGITFSALDNHTEQLKGATTWYVPSFYELTLLFENLEKINAQMTDKASGTTIATNLPTISFDGDGNGDEGFIMINNGNKGWTGIPSEEIRPICAF